MRRYLIAAAVVLIVACSLAAPPVLAASVVFGNNPTVCTGTATASAGCSVPGSTKTNPLIQNLQGALDLASVLSGAVATIFIFAGGVRFITANGDPSKVEGARDTVVYALVGLLVTLISRVLIGYVLSKMG